LNGLKTNNAPHSSVVIPHFIFGGCSFLIVAVLIILANTNLLEAYFNSKIIAITHMAVLGWATMIVFGALYQLIPVVFETSLYSEKLAKITFWTSAVSVLYLTYSFWVSAFTTHLVYASVFMFLSLFLFIINIVLSYIKSEIKNISSKFIIASIFWLAITEFVGTLIAFNFKLNFLSEIHLHYLKIHASLGTIGWFLLLIIGVGSTLIPMFLISHQLKKEKLVVSFVSINVGLLCLVLNWFIFSNSVLTIICWVVIVIGVISFMSFIYDSYKKRIRKKLDVGMQYTMLAIISIILPIIVSLILVLVFKIEYELLFRITTFYGFSIIFGFITTMILGQTYKTLPFIVWLEKYKNLVGKTKTPLPRELYSSKIAKIQFYFYVLSILSLALGLIMKNFLAIKIGSFSLLIVAILYNINVLKIIFHKVKNSNNE
tara:strand:- start:18701 stop:19990 length:1290 start_codon:yes stop_codon:yes gene_type:complete